MVNPPRHDPESPFPYGENDVDALLRAAFKRQKAKSQAGARDEPPFTLESGETPVLGEFRILREIGRGRLGIVFEAEEMTRGERVALRVLPRHLALRESLMARLRRVASLAAELEHPGIVRVLFLGRSDDVHYAVMELAPGAPLDRVIHRLRGRDPAALTGPALREAVGAVVEESSGVEAGTDSERSWTDGFLVTVAGLAAQAARALDHAHGHGVMHGDLKPSRLRVRPDGQVTLTDFGLVHPADREFLSPGPEPLGGLPYTAPELIADPKAELDPRSDVFSLGAILYELATLERPFGGDSLPEVVRNLQGREPVDPSRVNPLVSPRLAAIVLHALEKDPAHRYPRAWELAEDLEWLLSR